MTTNLFQLKTSFDIDNTKESMIFIIKEPLYEYSHQFAFIGEFMDVLERKYNIIILSMANNTPNRKNYFVFNKREYDRLNQNVFKRKTEKDDSVEYNDAALYASLLESFNKYFHNIKIKNILLGFHEYLILPLISYVNDDEFFKSRQNKFHDIVAPKNSDLVNQATDYIKDIGKRYNDRVSILAFSMYDKNLVSNLIVFLYHQYSIDMVYTLNVDPSVFFGYLDYNNVKYKNYYYATDKRGTRNFDYFPLAHFQHIYTEHKYLEFPKDKTKTNEFFMSGSLIHHNDGARSDDTFMLNYLKPLETLNPEKNSMWSPIKLNGLYLKESQLTSAYSQKAKEKAFDLKNKFTTYLTEHPLYKGFFLTKELTNKIISYKYGMILRCTTFEDSLNPRPVHYTYLGILPFLDPLYDPAYLCIPKHIQDKLVVYNGWDIIEKIKYFNNNENERLEILSELYELFKIDEFIKTWKRIIYNAF